MIKWKGSNMCLDLRDGKGVSGTEVQIWSCYDHNINQQWTFDDVEEVDDCDSDSTPATFDESDCEDDDDETASPSITAAPSASVSTIGGELWAGGDHKPSSSDDWSSASSIDEWSSPSSTGSSDWSASSTSSGVSPSSTGGASYNGDMSGYLQVKGTSVVDSNGNNLVLKGTNLGGWLVWEDWMCGIIDNSGSADRFPQTTLNNRFGEDKTYELMNVWLDNWLVSSDFDVLAGMGFNVVRLPFSYKNFIKSDGSYISDSSGNLDLSRLEWAIAEAKKRNIYVIPTYHIWDGQEERYSTISEDSSEGQTQRNKAGELWTKIAAHFAGENAIAAYDAINEPTGSANNNLQRDLYNAIRKGDSKRIIIMESIAAAPDSDWTNVMYSMHEYLMMGENDDGYNQNMFEQGVRGDTNKYNGVGVPTYIGEFMASGNTLSWMLDQMNQMNIWWSGWTYKTVNMDRWGLYNFGGSMRVDVSSDDFDTIKSKWSNMGGTSKSIVVDAYTAAAGGSKWKRAEAVERAVKVSPRFEEPRFKRSGVHGGRSRRAAHGAVVGSF